MQHRTNQDVIDEFLNSARKTAEEAVSWVSDDDYYETDYYTPRLYTVNGMVHLFLNMYHQWLANQTISNTIVHPNFSKAIITLEIDTGNYNQTTINITSNDDSFSGCITQDDSVYLSVKSSNERINSTLDSKMHNSWILHFLCEVDQYPNRRSTEHYSDFSDEFLEF